MPTREAGLPTNRSCDLGEGLCCGWATKARDTISNECGREEAVGVNVHLVTYNFRRVEG